MNENKWDKLARIFKGIQTDFKFMELDKEANLDRYNGELPKWIQMSVNTVDSGIEVDLTKCKKYEYYGIFKIEFDGNISFEEMTLHLPVMPNTRFYARGVTTVITDPIKLAEKIECHYANEFAKKLDEPMKN